MIRLDNISKQNGHQILFIEASAALHKGEKVGLVGPNGAGKTTLFRMINGEEQPDEGQVSVDRGTGKINVHEVWSAVDTGVALQPKNIQAQIESSVVFGISGLRQQLTFKGGVPQQSNFHDYPVLRMNEVPKITTKVLVTDNLPGGIGEVGLPPVAPAVANAVFKLIGKRLRALPFDRTLVKA